MVGLSNSEINTQNLFSIAKSSGAGVIGVADLSLLKGLEVYSISLERFKYGISIGVPLPNIAIDMIELNNPGILYAHAYHLANNLIDTILLRIAGWIVSEGYLALVVPASLRVDLKRQIGHISHKAVACAAGVGWIGRNGLLINPIYGPRLRLGTLLTDMPLKSGEPMKNQCGTCRLCIEACPTGALKYSDFEYYPMKREDIFNPEKCSSRLEDMKNLLSKLSPTYAATVCGLCIKVCPIGKKAIR